MFKLLYLLIHLVIAYLYYHLYKDHCTNHEKNESRDYTYRTLALAYLTIFMIIISELMLDIPH